jgi:ammonium transporter, Amt family
MGQRVAAIARPQPIADWRPMTVEVLIASISWRASSGGGDPYFANANAGAAVLNTNVSTATALLVWTMMDTQFNGKPSIVGAINGMIAGLVGITPAAGYVDGWGALIIGV